MQTSRESKTRFTVALAAGNAVADHGHVHNVAQGARAGARTVAVAWGRHMVLYASAQRAAWALGAPVPASYPPGTWIVNSAGPGAARRGPP
jgi:hypothetical protein